MCTLVSRDCVPFCRHMKHHVYPGDQGTHNKLDQIQNLLVRLENLMGRKKKREVRKHLIQFEKN